VKPDTFNDPQEDKASSSLIFQAAVEAPLALAFKDPDGAWECRDYTVTVVAERVGLDEADVVVDFRVLEAALDKALEPLRGRRPQEIGMDAPMDAAKWIAEAVASSVAPSIAPPATLAAVSLQDSAGRRVTLQK
jgi:hypothetical protein